MAVAQVLLLGAVRRRQHREFPGGDRPGERDHDHRVPAREQGIFASDSKFWTWYNDIKMNTIKRRTVVVSLIDEAGNPKMVWTLNNAWPTKITGTDLKSEGNEVAVESVEIAFETLTVAVP
jgi:phage tail-like protein